MFVWSGMQPDIVKRRILIVDLDVHQGYLYGEMPSYSKDVRPELVTFWIHCEANYFSEKANIRFGHWIASRMQS
jgi:acetoin utilization deacetylase AcuC-like enzyme